MNRWTIGLVLGFCVVFFANGLLVWFSMQGSDPVDPTYEQEAR